MDKVSIKRWDEFKTSNPNYTWVAPTSHPYAHLIDRWWYKGRVIYETCVEIDGPFYKVFIDGTTPSMELELEFEPDGSTVTILKSKDIRRIAITADRAELSKEDGQYVDIDMEQRDGYKVRYTNLPPNIIDFPIIITADPAYDQDNIYMDGLTIKAIAGDFIGGMPKPLLRTPSVTQQNRWQYTDDDGNIESSLWTEVENSTVIPHTINAREYTQVRAAFRFNDYDPATGEKRIQNKFLPWQSILTYQPPTIDVTGRWVDTKDQYYNQRMVAETASWNDSNLPIDVVTRYQWQRKTDDVWVGASDWVKYSGIQQISRIEQYPTTIRIKFTYKDLSGNVTNQGATPELVLTEPPPDFLELQSDVKPKFPDDTDNRKGVPIAFTTGTFKGDTPFKTFWRYKKQGSDGVWQSIGAFVEYDNTVQTQTLTVPAETDANRIHIESKAINDNGDTVYNNSDKLTLSR